MLTFSSRFDPVARRGAPLSADVVSTQEDLFHCPVLRNPSETILQVSPYITEAGDAILTVFLRTAGTLLMLNKS